MPAAPYIRQAPPSRYRTGGIKGGELLYLALNEAFSIQGVEDATVLATIIVSKEGPNVEVIGGLKPR